MHPRLALFASLTDDDLLVRVKLLADKERRATVELVAALCEVERRRLYLPQGCASLFVYCTEKLHLSEHAAYNRIEAARASLRFPVILNYLEEGSLSLTAVRLLAPLLRVDDHERILDSARYKSKREVEVMMAACRPKPDAATLVRKLPARPAVRLTSQPSLDATSDVAPCPTGSSLTGVARVGRPAAMSPLSPERYRIQFTASREFYDKLRRAQALMRHTIPNGEPGAILDRALDLLLEVVEKRKLAATPRPQPQRAGSGTSRHIPAAVKREVWKRDGGCCAFIGSSGRCGEQAFLEFHHVVPYAEGGSATTGNIQLRCRAHNAFEAAELAGRLFANDDGHSFRNE